MNIVKTTQIYLSLLVIPTFIVLLWILFPFDACVSWISTNLYLLAFAFFCFCNSMGFWEFASSGGIGIVWLIFIFISFFTFVCGLLVGTHFIWPHNCSFFGFSCFHLKVIVVFLFSITYATMISLLYYRCTRHTQPRDEDLTLDLNHQRMQTGSIGQAQLLPMLPHVVHLEEGVPSLPQVKKASFLPGWRESLAFQILRCICWCLCAIFALSVFPRYSDTALGVIMCSIIFQLMRIISIRLLISLNHRLHQSREVSALGYFTQILYLLYYRLLFVSISSWASVVFMGLVSAGTLVFVYPLQMTRTWHNFLYHRVRSFVTGGNDDSALTKLFQDSKTHQVVTFEQHVNAKCVQYFFYVLADYYSLITFSLFIPTIRSSWNADYYPGLTSALSADETQGLLLRYLYLLAFEMSVDFAIRKFVKWRLGINITKKSTLKTLNHSTNRFLYILEIIFFLSSVYIIQFYP